ncbi:hypothetical protein O181_067528 [Austropuccinia psidii MF-1]|uniref:Wax synthase domain-containing protein n=1 Tax=Austropuccinia psidii MF-1 TaxID=1389203 RepID=A0A9Q3I4L4_9BASI|nr:hypothetical protein [Austropuccinia psidii MF-1]
MPLNIVTSIATFYLALKSFEWATLKRSNQLSNLKKIKKNLYIWESHPQIHHQNQNQNQNQQNQNQNQQTQNQSNSNLNLIWWSIWQITSLRGLRFDWSPKIPCQNYNQIYLLKRIFLTKLLGFITTALIVTIRDSKSSRSSLALLNLLHLPNNSILLNIFAELIYTLAFGIHVASSMDNKVTLIILLNHFLYKSCLHLSLPNPICDYLNPLHWPLFYHDPHLSSNLADFWGKRWHQILRQVFKQGGKFFSKLASILDTSSNSQKIASLFGTFFFSALLHEYIFWTSLRPQNSSFSTLFQILPGSLIFFILQPIGILLEPYLIPLIPKKLGGGTLWTGLFLLSTATLFRRHWISVGHYDHQFPPLSNWNWKFILGTI